MWTFRLESSTKTFGQANSISASLLTSWPARVTSRCRMSNALLPASRRSSPGREHAGSNQRERPEHKSRVENRIHSHDVVSY